MPRTIWNGSLSFGLVNVPVSLTSASRDLDLRKPGKGPSKREVEMAGKLVESLHRRFDPEDHEDTYREAVLELIERKAKGEDLTPEEPEPEEEPSDLTAALQASLGS